MEKVQKFNIIQMDTTVVARHTVTCGHKAGGSCYVDKMLQTHSLSSQTLFLYRTFHGQATQCVSHKEYCQHTVIVSDYSLLIYFYSFLVSIIV